MTKSKSYKFKMGQNNYTELSGDLFNYMYHKSGKTCQTNRLNMFALLLPYFCPF